MTLSGWQTLGAVSPPALSEGRLLLHHAAQLPAAVGRSLAPARPDDGHTSLEWRADARDLAGQEVSGPRPWRAALRPEDLSLAVFAGGTEVDRLALEGWTGAVLTGSEIVAAGGADAQAALAGGFVRGAVEALRARHQRRS